MSMDGNMTIAEALEHYEADYPWLDRTMLYHLLKAFQVTREGNKRGEKGGRPAVTYNYPEMDAMLRLVSEHRED